jgi:hypothetical protein
MPAIAVNCNLGEHGKSFHPSGIQIERNVLHTPSNRVIEYTHEWDAVGTRCFDNMVWASGETPVVSSHAGNYEMPWLDKNAMTHFKGNIYEDPRFLKDPSYEQIDLTQGPYNFENHTTESGLYSSSAYAAKVGAKIVQSQVKELPEVEPRGKPSKKVGPWWKKRERSDSDCGTGGEDSWIPSGT